MGMHHITTAADDLHTITLRGQHCAEVLVHADHQYLRVELVPGPRGARAVVSTRDGGWHYAGAGDVRDGQIVDCPADLGDDAYAAVNAAIAALLETV